MQTAKEKEEREWLKIIQESLYDIEWNSIPERFSFKYISEKPKLKLAIEQFMPELIDKIKALEAFEGVKRAQEKYMNRKWIYIIFFTLVWFALYYAWWAVVWFLLWFSVWNYFQPEKVAERIMNKALKNKK